MDISDIATSASTLELGTLIFFALSISVAAIVAWMTKKHYMQKNVYDQWMVALSQDYHKQNTKVIGQIERRGKVGLDYVDMIKEINNDLEIKQAVNYVLDYWNIKGTSAKYRIIDRDLAIPMAYHDIIYYFEGLHPWILYKRGYLLSIGDDSISNGEMLLRYLMDDLRIKHAKNAEIHKIDDGKTIDIFKNELEIGNITIDEKNKKACLKTIEGDEWDLTVEKKSGKLNIYSKEKDYHRVAYEGFEWLYYYCMPDCEYEKMWWMRHIPGCPRIYRLYHNSKNHNKKKYRQDVTIKK